MFETKKVKNIFFSLLLAICSQNVAAKGLLVGKTMYSGEIVRATCSLSAHDTYQEISLGAIPVRQIQNALHSTPKKFTLTLEECEGYEPDAEEESKAIQVTFNGVQGINQETYALSGTAQGINLQILDSDGYIAGNQKPLPVKLIKGNSQELTYYLRLIKTEPIVKAGSVYSIINYKINYQ